MSANLSLSTLPFEKAAEWWKEQHKPYWKPGTFRSYKSYIKRLLPFFKDIRLSQIHIGHFREYQRWRSEGEHKLGVPSINHDMNTLSQILREAGLWHEIEPLYKPLPAPKWTPPRVLTEAEEDKFFAFAAQNDDWYLAYCVSSLTNNTSASGSELRHIQLKHLQLDSDPPLIYVPSEHAKNEYRARVIPLNERGEIQVRRILMRAHMLGCTESDHYLFPFRTKGTNDFDPTKPASPWFLYKQWWKLVKAAMARGIISFRIRPHDMRHQMITKLLENGTPEETVMAIAGHVSQQMMRHYSHQRIDAKHRALSAIDPNKKRADSAIRFPMPGRRKTHA